MDKSIFVALSTFAEFDREPLRLLEEGGYGIRRNTTGRRLVKEEIIASGKGCEGIIAGVEPYDSAVLERLPGLQCISRCGVGMDAIDLAAAARLGIVVRNTPDVVVQPVAEMTVAMIFDLMRRLTAHTALIRSGSWKKIPGNLVSGKTAGIVGLGRIGRRVAQLLSALGCRICACDDRLSPRDCPGIELLPLDTLLAQSDIVTIHVSLPPGGSFVLGKREIGLMKQGAVLVNTSRGQFVDEAALHEALRSNKLSGAGLDVFPGEPYTGMLCGLDNVVLTPHAATLTVESRAQMEIEAVKNLLSFFGTAR
jgi:D-3-phosphoglycerate dehydrogenase / 2-oxoglutarate reductase